MTHLGSQVTSVLGTTFEMFKILMNELFWIPVYVSGLRNCRHLWRGASRFSKYLEILKWDNLSQLCPEWQLSDFSVKTCLRDLPPLSVDVRVVVELVDRGPLRHLGLLRHPAAGEDGRVVTEIKMSSPSLCLRVWLGVPAEHDILEGLPVLDTHEGVEEGVEGAGEVVQDPWQ